jgi:prepilin-type N-terminal cleavage/methylation domain-containing protein
MVRHTPISRPNARGFSLIELLITLAVVASLAAVMFPAFGKVHEMARRLMCQNNMRNLYMALEAFEQNSGNRPESLHVSPRPSLDLIARWNSCP